MGFSRQEYWSGFPFLPLGDLPPAGIKPMSAASPAGGFFTAEPLEKPPPNKLLKTNSWGLVYSGRWVLLGQSQLLDFDLIHWEALPQEKKLASYPWRAVWLWFSLSTFTELPLKTSAVTAAQRINLGNDRCHQESLFTGRDGSCNICAPRYSASSLWGFPTCLSFQSFLLTSFWQRKSFKRCFPGGKINLINRENYPLKNSF